jgi:site-specific DNA recombinase
MSAGWAGRKVGAQKGRYEMKAALYARVSTEEQTEGYSIDAQKRAFQALCQGRGWTPCREYIEEGKSARTDNINKRPVFKQMMSDAETKQFDVLVCHKLDRFSRNLRITLEYFEKLSKAGIAFTSISEQMDFSQPWGKFALAMLGAMAQFYSDNLSHETKKGWAERKAQGLYCGLLPFGAIKGEDGVPVPDPNTYPGLGMAFDLAAQGESDRRIAQLLNSEGYRTAGNQRRSLFAKDTVRGILTNRFYLGYLPEGNGNGKCVKGKHEAFVSEQLWNQAQEMRRRNATSTHGRCRSERKICSMSGITHCWYCKGRIHISCTKKGQPRLGCYNRAKGWDCGQRSAAVGLYEKQIEEYLGTFHIPEDYQNRILEAHRKLEAAYDNTNEERARWEAQLDRIKKLYKWGDISEEEYRRERQAFQKEMVALAPETRQTNLDKLAEFLTNIGEAWRAASAEQRNKLARTLFQEIWIKDNQVVAVKPQPELEPFFELNYDEFVNTVMKKRPRWDSNPRSSA